MAEHTTPRRNQINKMSPTEVAILSTIRVVENLGADVRLTDAVVLLQAARESVADFLDGVDSRRYVSNPPLPAPVPPVVAEEMVEAEGERIFNHVCKALDLDPNDGDCDSGDIADSIVAAVQGRLDRMRDTAPVPPVVTEAVEITEKECAELRAKIIELFDDMDRGRIRVAAYHQECNDAIRAAFTAALRPVDSHQSVPSDYSTAALPCADCDHAPCVCDDGEARTVKRSNVGPVVSEAMRDKCADEYMAASRMGLSHVQCIEVALNAYAALTPALPVVSEAMVERAARVDYEATVVGSQWQEAFEPLRQDIRTRMRSILTAALRPETMGEVSHDR